ncbi:MAG: 4Fe-4S binding protein [archaeon GB-1867-035]|nr:4Fe-4S binding protein [Candidatus Culexmicrobium profundum]
MQPSNLQLKKAKSFEIVVIAERCKGCGICIGLCPVQVLVSSNEFNSKGYNYAEAKYPEKCIGCRTCELHCPDFSIFIRPSSKPKFTLVKE